LLYNWKRPDAGKINHGDTVVFGNFSQDGLQYKEDKRAIEYVKSMAEFFPLNDGTKISAGQFMEKFGFTGEQQFTLLSKLSGGEKRRLHLMSILFLNPNFLYSMSLPMISTFKPCARWKNFCWNTRAVS
jgi:ATP-binding cassette subfamily F protein uup